MSTHINSELIVPGSVANLSTFPHPLQLDTHRNRTLSENDTTNFLPPAIMPAAIIATATRPRKFNRSLTEVRPDAYIFDDGAHFEVRTVLEENELITSSEDVNDYALSLRSRKLSVQSEEPEFCISPTPPHQTTTSQIVTAQSIDAEQPQQPMIRSDSITRRSLSIRQDTAQSNESKDTLTPLDGFEERTLIGMESNAVTSSTITSTAVNDEGEKQRFGLRRRNSQLGRRNSESQHYDINRSQNSLNIGGGGGGSGLLPKRQFSLTQSEPDTDDGNGAGTRGSLNQKSSVKAGRHMLLQIHAEYTSITDELESMITSPTSSLMDDKPKKMDQLTNPQFAAMLEKKHLKECEDDDYMVMEELLQSRSGSLESDDNLDGKSLIL